mgnify:CR=1 FL=1
MRPTLAAVLLVACVPETPGGGTGANSSVPGTTPGITGPSSTPQLTDGGPPETTDGIQVGEAGDDLPCEWVPAGDTAQTLPSDALADGLGVFDVTVDPAIGDPVDGEVEVLALADPQWMDEVPIGTGSTGNTGLCEGHRQEQAVRVALQSAAVTEQADGRLIDLGGVLTLIVVLPAEAATSEPRLMDPDDYGTLDWVFFARAEAAGLAGDVSWQADRDAGTYYWESVAQVVPR